AVKMASHRKSLTLRLRLQRSRLSRVTKPYSITRVKSYRFWRMFWALKAVNCAPMVSTSPSSGGPYIPPSESGSTNNSGDFQTRIAIVPDSADGTGKLVGKVE